MLCLSGEECTAGKFILFLVKDLKAKGYFLSLTPAWAHRSYAINNSVTYLSLEFLPVRCWICARMVGSTHWLKLTSYMSVAYLIIIFKVTENKVFWGLACFCSPHLGLFEKVNYTISNMHDCLTKTFFSLFLKICLSIEPSCYPSEPCEHWLGDFKVKNTSFSSHLNLGRIILKIENIIRLSVCFNSISLKDHINPGLS